MTMTTTQPHKLTQPLRDEHAELVPHIGALAAAGDAVDRVDINALRALVDESYEFLADELIPHARAEEAALYPVVQRAVGAPEMTATMARDHVEVGALTAELASLRDRLRIASELDDDLANGLRRVLYGLHHLVKVHFAKEEEVYLPILEERLSESEAKQMFADMHAASHHGH
jgi:iron-sulfur cluster repair protein YtfE (RIC family)